jgi:ethanolamine-phosphate cytidylyltransferase
MLLCTKSHFIKSLINVLNGKEGIGTASERTQLGSEMLQRIKDYATNETGLKPGAEVWTWSRPHGAKIEDEAGEVGRFDRLVSGVGPKPGQRLVYVDGGFDLFSSGHIEFLRQVHDAEKGQAYIVAGVHDDEVINHWKGLNYPIMNIFERGLCVLQCKYINSVIFGAPFSPSKKYLQAFPMGTVSAVYHGPTSFMPLTYDPYTEAKELGVFHEISSHAFQNVNAGEIVMRIMKGRKAFEERQRKKGEKHIGEEAVRRRELMEQEAAENEQQRLG